MRIGSEVADQCADARAGCREGEYADGPAVAGIFQGVAVRAFESQRTGDGSCVAVGEGYRHGLQAQFSAAAVVLELVNFSLNEGAGRDDDFVAGGDRRNDLSVDVISAMEAPGLDRLR